MNISKRQLRRLIREWFSDEHDPVTGKRDRYEGETLTADFINPDKASMPEYLDLAQQLGLQVTTNTPRMLTVQGSQKALIEFGAYMEDMEGGPNLRGGAGFDERGLKDAMRPVTEITRRQLRRIIKEAIATPPMVSSPAGRDRYIGQSPLEKMIDLSRGSDDASLFLDSAAEKVEDFQGDKDAWVKTYDDHVMYTNVFNVPADLYKDVFFYIAEEGMSVRDFQRKLTGL